MGSAQDHMRDFRPVARETLHSYLARAAFYFQVTPETFFKDLGFNRRHVFHGSIELEHLLTRTLGLPDKSAEELLSWTPLPAGTTDCYFRGEPYGTKSLLRTANRICPQCQLEDKQSAHVVNGLMPPPIHGHWHLREVDICVKHSLILQPLGTEPELAEATDYDMWLDDRLTGNRSDSWLDDLSLHAATTFALLLGVEISRKSGGEPPSGLADIRAARNLGFQVMRLGREQVYEQLVELAKNTPGHRAAFGNLIVRCEDQYLQDERFAPLIGCLRDAILHACPLPAGQTILGYTLPERRVHSISSAASELKISHDLIRSALIQRKVVERDNPAPDRCVAFQVDQHLPAILLATELITTEEAGRILGISATLVRALIDHTILAKAAGGSRHRRALQRIEVENLRDQLLASAQAMTYQEDDWIPLQDVSHKMKVPYGAVLSCAMAGHIRLWFRTAPNSLADLYMSASDTRKLPDTIRMSSLGPHDNPHEQLMPLQTAKRRLNLPDDDTLKRLVLAGHTSACRIDPPQGRRQNIQMSEDDLAVFKSKFTTLGLMATEIGLNRQKLQIIVNQLDIPYFQDGVEAYPRIWLRDSILPKLRQMSP